MLLRVKATVITVLPDKTVTTAGIKRLITKLWIVAAITEDSPPQKSPFEIPFQRGILFCDRLPNLFSFTVITRLDRVICLLLRLSYMEDTPVKPEYDKEEKNRSMTEKEKPEHDGDDKARIASG